MKPSKHPAVQRLKKRMSGSMSGSSSKPEFTREAYFRALALHYLSSVAHETGLMLNDAGNSEAGDEHYTISSELHKQANALFPLLPHDDFARWERGGAWLKKQGIKT